MSPQLPAAIDPALLRRLRASQGRPLDAATRDFAEQLFQRSYKSVRVHDSRLSHQVAGQFGARAFTLGTDIFLGRGAPQAGSRQARQLYIHELTHVNQFLDGRMGGARGVSDPQHALEHEARSAERGAVSAPAVEIGQVVLLQDGKPVSDPQLARRAREALAHAGRALGAELGGPPSVQRDTVRIHMPDADLRGSPEKVVAGLGERLVAALRPYARAPQRRGMPALIARDDTDTDGEIDLGEEIVIVPEDTGRRRQGGRVRTHLEWMTYLYNALRHSLGKAMESGETGSLSIGLSVGVSTGAKLNDGVGISAGVRLVYSGNINVQDDRRLRTSHKLKLVGKAGAGIEGIADVNAEVGIGLGITFVYQSPRHWAAQVAHRGARMISALRHVGRGHKLHKALLQEDFDRAEAQGATRGTKEHKLLTYASQPVTKVISVSSEASVSASFLQGLAGLGFAVTVQGMNFRKVTRDPERRDRRTQDRTDAISVSASLSVSVLGFSVTLTYVYIDGHANPDNDGHYLNLNFGVGAGATGHLNTDLLLIAAQTVEAGLPAGDPSPSRKWLQAIKAALQLGLSTLSLSPPKSMSAAGISVSAGGSIEWNFVWSQSRFRLQYARLGRSGSVAASASVPVMPALFVDLGGSVGYSSTSIEVLGTTTLTYFLTVYNGLVLRAKEKAELLEGDARERRTLKEWNAYLDTHALTVQRVLTLLGNAEAPVRLELEDWADDGRIGDSAAYRRLRSGGGRPEDLTALFAIAATVNKEGVLWRTTDQKKRTGIKALKGRWKDRD